MMVVNYGLISSGRRSDLYAMVFEKNMVSDQLLDTLQ